MHDTNAVDNPVHSSSPIAPIGIFAKPGYLLLITAMTIFLIEAKVFGTTWMSALTLIRTRWYPMEYVLTVPRGSFLIGRNVM